MTNREEPSRKVPGRNPQTNAEKRGHDRYAANVSAQVIELESQTITDLGALGCYVDTSS